MPYYVYLLASKYYGTLYIGSTSDLVQRIWQHKNRLFKGFTDKYHVDRLVYFEELQDAAEMVKRERELKEWKRSWKIVLIEKENPKWNDLYKTIVQ